MMSMIFQMRLPWGMADVLSKTKSKQLMVQIEGFDWQGARESVFKVAESLKITLDGENN